MSNPQKNDARDIFPPPRWVIRKKIYGRPSLPSAYHITSPPACQANFSLMKIHLLSPNDGFARPVAGCLRYGESLKDAYMNGE